MKQKLLAATTLHAVSMAMLSAPAEPRLTMLQAPECSVDARIRRWMAQSDQANTRKTRQKSTANTGKRFAAIKLPPLDKLPKSAYLAPQVIQSVATIISNLRPFMSRNNDNIREELVAAINRMNLHEKVAQKTDASTQAGNGRLRLCERNEFYTESSVTATVRKREPLKPIKTSAFSSESLLSTNNTGDPKSILMIVVQPKTAKETEEVAKVFEDKAVQPDDVEIRNQETNTNVEVVDMETQAYQEPEIETNVTSNVRECVLVDEETQAFETSSEDSSLQWLTVTRKKPEKMTPVVHSAPETTPPPYARVVRPKKIPRDTTFVVRKRLVPNKS